MSAVIILFIVQIALFALTVVSLVAYKKLVSDKREWPVYVEEIAPENPGFGANLASPNLDMISLREKSYSFGF